jgi:O-acetyl-ADP-ribose deacetylase (regulator of RNase III)
LLGGGGVDGAIHNAAGDSLYDECLTLNGGQTGYTKITRGHRLPSRFILHTVGPIGENRPALISCYSTCLGFIDGSEPMPYSAAPIRSVTFCGVSTGIYGYPLLAATKVALETARRWLEEHHDKVDMIVFCTFLEKEWDCYEALMPFYFPPAPDAQFNDDWISKHQPAAASSSEEESESDGSDTESQ